jgi:chemotaxis family two-component system response regulator Rcp1
MRESMAAPIEILVVEDCVRFTQETLKDAKVLVSLQLASDGTEAMTVLRREGQHANVPCPDLPKKDGREVLGEIKEGPTLKSIDNFWLPVVKLQHGAHA